MAIVVKIPFQRKTISVSFTQKPKFKAEFKGVVLSVNGEEPYKGSYSATPKVEQQVFETRHKFMEDDFSVKAIPFYDVSNTSGGKTIYIGSEV